MKGIELILTLNYFVFDDKWYLQIKGVAMGTKVAVVLAIFTVGYLEIKLYTIPPNYFSIDYCLYIIGKDSLMTVSFFGRKAKICNCLKNSSTHFIP